MHIVAQLVLILFLEERDVVLHFPGRVPNEQRAVRCVEVDLREVLVLLMVKPNLREKRLFVRGGNAAPLVQQVEDAQTVRVEHVQQRFVVLELDRLHEFSESLGLKHRLLRLEHVCDIQLMQLFIREVYAQLLEAIALEHLEAVDVKQSDVEEAAALLLRNHFRSLEVLVESEHQPRKQSFVECFAQRIPYFLDFAHCEVLVQDFRTDLNSVGG